MTKSVIRTQYEAEVAAYWDGKRDDFNLVLAKDDGLVHHHFGLGDFDHSVLATLTQDQITRELHRLENNQVHSLMSAIGDLHEEDHVLDAGSGRGGTSFMLHSYFHCFVDGVTLSAYQVAFSQHLATLRGVQDKVRFHCMNAVASEFDNQWFQCVVSNEVTMYFEDLDELLREFGRILVPGGRYVLITWCMDDLHSDPLHFGNAINEHYLCRMHTRTEYFTALAKGHFIPYIVKNLTCEATPYWELRSQSAHKSGVEEWFLNGYRQGALAYLLIGTHYIPPCFHIGV